MKKILVIGSAVADVIIDLEDNLPKTGEDVHVRSQTMRLGGCAFNTFHVIRHFHVPVIPFFPVGRGAYGDFIWNAFSKERICTPIPRPETENGCCYCFIEPDGERTFISYHGAEYRFCADWFSLLDPEQIESIYFCGLEIEEPTGPVILDFLEANPRIPKYFAPGPRLTKIDPRLMNRIFACSPVLHLNAAESMLLSGKDSINEAAKALHALTNNMVLITLGSRGCCFYDGSENDPCYIPGVPAVQQDTTGAGDSHIGAVMAARYLNLSYPVSLQIANRISSKIVEVSGAVLTAEEFREALRGTDLLQGY